MHTQSQIELPLGGCVRQISLPYLYNLSKELRPLENLGYTTSIKEYLYILINAERTLTAFLSQSVYTGSLKAISAPGNELLASIKKLTTDPDKDRFLDFFDTYSVSNALKEFEVVLVAEMNTVNAFLVTKKRGYDSTDLISQAEVLFPDDFILKTPEAQFDIREAGRCLAFEMSTAAGFHLMRATELVIRRYYDVVTNGKERPERASIGDYLRILDDDCCGELKTRETLRQIKNLHRNELMHPEIQLTLDDALSLVGIAQSAIISMLKEIPLPQFELTNPT